MHDVLIIGGGVIGLSLAWDLARHGCSVLVIDQGEPGSEASWAGAGILPPATRTTAMHASDQLRGLASELHPEWAEELQRLTGIDTGFRRCGGLYLARSAVEGAALAAWGQSLHEEGIEAERLSPADLFEIEPGLRPSDSVARRAISMALLLPGEAQLRNPWHLQALVAACEAEGVTIRHNVAAVDAAIAAGEIEELKTSAGPLRAGHYCFTAGAWTGQLLKRLGIAIGVLPIRGQIVLFRSERPAITRIVNEGSRYLVPRDDGRVLAGSTEEEVGFDKRTTDEAIAGLTHFARELVPALSRAPIERTWAGLRPGSFDGLPYLGRLPGLANASIAAGHFRTGLFLSPATAVVMSQLIRGEQPMIDLAPLRIGR